MTTEYSHLNYLRKIAKRCHVCNVPMIGTTSTDRQKFCSPECRNESKTKKWALVKFKGEA